MRLGKIFLVLFLGLNLGCLGAGELLAVSATAALATAVGEAAGAEPELTDEPVASATSPTVTPTSVQSAKIPVHANPAPPAHANPAPSAHATHTPAQRPKVGLVLSGGGAKGAAHIGVLKLIEELKIPIDYIAGTSMGSIVGGLYAYGYSAKELDSIFKNADWNSLLSDQAIRKDIFISEKNFREAYFFSIGLTKDAKIKLPIGIKQGHNIDNLLYSLTADRRIDESFDSLKIPFSCVATDIISSRKYVFRSGNLSTAMRASMAIPGVFSPVEIDTLMLVDGGLSNNFPVDEVLKMGADIVIGVDVGHDFKTKDDIKTLSNILERIMFMSTKARLDWNKKRVGVLIEPNMDGFSAASFFSIDTIIKRGEDAAIKNYDSLKSIADIFRNYSIEEKPLPYYLQKKESSHFISKIEYLGLEKFTSHYVNQYLQIIPRSRIKTNDITRAIERLYGSMSFEKITYQYVKNQEDDSSYTLVLDLSEKVSNTFHLGVRYDNQHSVSLLLGLMLKDIGIKNTYIEIAGELSKHPNLDFRFVSYPNINKKKEDRYSFWKPSIGIGYKMNIIPNEDLYHFFYDRDKVSHEFFMNSHKIRLYAQSILRSNLFELGISTDYHHISERFVDDSDGKQKDFFTLVPYLSFVHDSYDKNIYPSRGIKANILVEAPIGLKYRDIYAKQFLSAMLNFNLAFCPKHWLRIYPGIAAFANFFNTNTTPMQYKVYQGGLSPVSSGLKQMNFAGLLPFQADGDYAWNVHTNFAFKIIKELYLDAKLNVGMVENTIKDMLNLNNFIYGGALGLSYNTPFGPIGIHFQSSNIHYFNIWINALYWL